MNTTPLQLKTNDWIRFQDRHSRLVLEGYIQAFSPEGDLMLVGKAPNWPENQWFALDDLQILHHQTPHATVDEERVDAPEEDGGGLGREHLS